MIQISTLVVPRFYLCKYLSIKKSPMNNIKPYSILGRLRLAVFSCKHAISVKAKRQRLEYKISMGIKSGPGFGWSEREQQDEY